MGPLNGLSGPKGTHGTDLTYRFAVLARRIARTPHASSADFSSSNRRPRQAPISSAISTKACSPPNDDVQPTFLKRPGRAVRRNCQRRMVVRPRHRSEYHLRRSPALTRPRPGTSNSRPACTASCSTGTARCGETHLIEGLNDGRFAIYTKVHHAPSMA